MEIFLISIVNVSYKSVASWFSELLLCVLFLKNNQLKKILVPKRHFLGRGSVPLAWRGQEQKPQGLFLVLPVPAFHMLAWQHFLFANLHRSSQAYAVFLGPTLALPKKCSLGTKELAFYTHEMIILLPLAF